MLNRLNTIRSDAKALILVLPRICILASLGFASYIASKHSLFIALIIFYAYCIIFNFSSWVGISHELSHGTVFKTKSLNIIFLKLFSFLTISNEALFLVTHSEHHKDPHGLTDFETPYTSLPRPKPTLIERFYAVFDAPKLANTAKYIWLNASGKIPHAELKMLLEKRIAIESVAQSAREKIIYLTAIICFSFILGSSWPVIFLILPNFVATCLAKNLALMQHPTHAVLNELNLTHVTSGNTKKPIASVSKEEIRDSLDLEMPRLPRFLYASMNYHATHHKNTAIPSYHLAEASTCLLRSNEIMRAEISWGLLFRLTGMPI